MDIDRSLTILLIIKDRVPYTLRWMAYADKICFPFKILVADGGKDEIVSEKLLKRANFQNANYKYIRYPYDQTYSHLYAKMADALLKVDTPFVAVTDDACFYIVNGLRRSIEFLYTHQDYSACGGNIGSFSVWPDNYNGALNPAYGEEIHFFSNMYRYQQLTGETAGTRVASHFALFSPTYYDIHRIEQLGSCFNVLKEIDLKDIFLAELLTSLLTICAGKSRRLDDLYMLRQIKNRGSSAGDHRKKWGDEFDRMLLESWSDDFAKFEYAIASAISDKDGVSIDDARSQVKKGYRMHIAPLIVKLLSNKNAEVKQSIIIGGMKNIVRKLKYDSMTRRFLHNIYATVRTTGNDRSRRNLSTPIHRSSEFYKDIKPLQDFLTSL